MRLQLTAALAATLVATAAAAQPEPPVRPSQGEVENPIVPLPPDRGEDGAPPPESGPPSASGVPLADEAGDMSTGRAEKGGEEEEDEGEARTEVPTPPDRPAEVEEAREAPRSGARNTVSDTTTDAGETACRARLAAAPLVWEEVDPIREGRCGIAAPVRVTRAAGLDLTPAATLNCRTAEALALWLRDDVTPAARRHLGADPTDVRIGSAYVCRNRNGRASGKLSEHAFGNAVDVGGFVVDGDEVPVVSRDHKSAPRRVAFQREIRRAACNRFTTVLGPGTDGSHSDHFHLDLRDRRRGYRLCQ